MTSSSMDKTKNQETIRQRHPRRSHQRDGEAESGDVSTRAHHVSECCREDCEVVTLDPQLARDEDRRLLAEYESCRTQKFAAADQIIKSASQHAVSRI